MENNQSNEYFDYKTEDGKFFLLGYRKFIVALLWVVLMSFGVIMSLLVIKVPTSGQTSIVMALIISCGFFCSFFVGGNVLAKLWAENYKMNMNVSSSLDNKSEHKSESIEKNVKIVYVDKSEDSAYIDEENKLPPAKPRIQK